IGVIRLRPILDTVYKRWGIHKNSLFTDPGRDMFSEKRILGAHARHLNQTSLQATYDLFVQRVGEGRNLEPEAVRSMAEGQVFLASDFQDAGLIDGLKSFHELVADYQQMQGYAPHTRFHWQVYPDIKIGLQSMLRSNYRQLLPQARYRLPGLLQDIAQLLLENKEDIFCYDPWLPEL
ncbi:MAG: S49 family peptidase, partial [Leptospiraceae bacterium]|nr:S49 family peptidase [Leptospiraceae bacterium]